HIPRQGPSAAGQTVAALAGGLSGGQGRGVPAPRHLRGGRALEFILESRPPPPPEGSPPPAGREAHGPRPSCPARRRGRKVGRVWGREGGWVVGGGKVLRGRPSARMVRPASGQGDDATRPHSHSRLGAAAGTVGGRFSLSRRGPRPPALRSAPGDCLPAADHH